MLNNDFNSRYLQEILGNVSIGLKARLSVNKRSEEEQTRLMESQKKKMDTLSTDCQEVHALL